MTPGIKVLEKANVIHKVHEYSHDPTAESYGQEAAEKLNVEEYRVFKTLVVSLDGKELAVGVVPVTAKLNMKRMAKALGAKKAMMAEQTEVERSTGYVLGGVSPLGQKKRLKTVIDLSAQSYETIFVSAGRRGLEIELRPDDLVRLVSGEYNALCQ